MLETPLVALVSWCSTPLLLVICLAEEPNWLGVHTYLLVELPPRVVLSTELSSEPSRGRWRLSRWLCLAC